MEETTLQISVSRSQLLAKIKRNLGIIGKRAKNTKGEALFTDLTTSTLEDPIFDDLLYFGAENIVSELSDVSSSYVETASSSTAAISFVITSTRWNTTTTIKDLENALSGLFTNYLYNFCLARYLSAIHPQMGDKYPPLFGQTYTDHCTLLISNIKTLAFLKRDAQASAKSYEDVKIKEDDK